MADAARVLPADEVLTIVEAAALCRVSCDVLYRLASAGDVPAVKVGGQWRLVRSELLRWLVESAVSSTSTRAAANGGRRSPVKAARRSGSRSTASPTTPPTAPLPSGTEPVTSTRARLLRQLAGDIARHVGSSTHAAVAHELGVSTSTLRVWRATWLRGDA